MSSFVRCIQRMRTRTSKGAVKRCVGRHVGDRVGVTNPEAKDRLARLAREEKRKSARG